MIVIDSLGLESCDLVYKNWPSGEIAVSVLECSVQGASPVHVRQEIFISDTNGIKIAGHPQIQVLSTAHLAALTLVRCSNKLPFNYWISYLKCHITPEHVLRLCHLELAANIRFCVVIELLTQVFRFKLTSSKKLITTKQNAIDAAVVSVLDLREFIHLRFANWNSGGCD